MGNKADSSRIMGHLILVWCIGILMLVHHASCVYSPQMETQIRAETLLNASYDAIARPDNVTKVKVRLNVLAIDELDLKNQKFSLAGWLTFEWDDWRLAWNKTARGDIEYIFSPPDKIWKPELIVDNSLTTLGVISDDNLHLKIRSDGRVDWEPPILFTTHCQVDITFYPYDHQMCGIDIVSWGYTESEVSLQHLGEINLEDFQPHGEWSVYKTHTEETALVETNSDGTVDRFPQVDFNLYISRRTDFYNLNVMIPIILTSLLIVLVFIVPVDSGEKLSYVLTVLLSLAVLMTLISDRLPATSITTSVLGVYLAIVLILSAIAVLCTVIVLIYHHRQGKPEYTRFSVYLARKLAKITCWKPEGSRQSTPVSKIAPSGDRDADDCAKHTEEPFDVTWIQMAKIFDRFFFILFLSVTVAMNFGFVVALTAGASRA